MSCISSARICRTLSFSPRTFRDAVRNRGNALLCFQAPLFPSFGHVLPSPHRSLHDRTLCHEFCSDAYSSCVRPWLAPPFCPDRGDLRLKVRNNGILPGECLPRKQELRQSVRSDKRTFLSLAGGEGTHARMMSTACLPKRHFICAKSACNKLSGGSSKAVGLQGGEAAWPDANDRFFSKKHTRALKNFPKPGTHRHELRLAAE